MLTWLNSNLTLNTISLFFTLISVKRDFFFNLIGNVVFDEDISLCSICVWSVEATHSAVPLLPLSCSHHILTSSVTYY